MVVGPPTQVLLLGRGLSLVRPDPTSNFSCPDSFLVSSPLKSACGGFVGAGMKLKSPTSNVSQSNAVCRRRHALVSPPAFCPSPFYSVSIIIRGLAMNFCLGGQKHTNCFLPRLRQETTTIKSWGRGRKGLITASVLSYQTCENHIGHSGLVQTVRPPGHHHLYSAVSSSSCSCSYVLWYDGSTDINRS